MSKSDPSADELALINRFSRKELAAEDVYTFPVVLCDNDIDRDGEHFSDSALEKLAQLFVGVTGIYDHQPSAKNQAARIYCCEVQDDDEQKTVYGAPYKRLLAKAYVPICESSKELISMIESGIRKEVSVGCSVAKCICSVCGKDMRIGSCRHVKGKSYAGKICFGILDEPTDAYEWSFTAVPAQKRAGVVKSYSYGADEDVNTYIAELKKSAEQGERYRSILGTEAVKAGIAAKVCITSGLLEKMVSGLDADELVELKSCFEKAAENIYPGRRQTCGELSVYGEKRQDVSEYSI